MTAPNDSITITPGTGATVATHLAQSKEFQAVVLADETGHIQGSKDTWVVSTTNTAHVAAARTTLIDLFNASGSGEILRVAAVYIIPTLTAVAGVGLTYEIIRTSAVGTGGTTITPVVFDTTSAALPAQVTARTKPTGGATTSTTMLYVNGTSEETSTYATLASQINHIPQLQCLGANRCIVLREGEGLKVDQTTSSSIGSVNVVMVFTAE